MTLTPGGQSSASSVDLLATQSQGGGSEDVQREVGDLGKAESSASSVNLLDDTGRQVGATQATQYEQAGFAQSLGVSGSSVVDTDTEKSGQLVANVELDEVEKTARMIRSQLDSELAKGSSSSKSEDGF